MKNFVMAGFAVFAFVLGVTNSVFSQSAINSDIATIKIINEQAKSHWLGYAAISPKAMRDFRKNFTNVNNEIWSKTKYGFIAQFTNEDTRVKVKYDNKGNWNCTEKAYAEKKLQREVRTIVKSVYFDYTINWITEITAPGDFAGPAYIIQMEDEGGYKSICLYEGEMRTLEDIQKAGHAVSR